MDKPVFGQMLKKLCLYDSRLQEKLHLMWLQLQTISAGFAVTGIWPVITDIFEEEDFLPSQVIDRVLNNC